MHWTKPSANANPQGCVQVRTPSKGITEIGDTKNPDGPTLTDTATPNSPALVCTKTERDAFKLGAQTGKLRGANPQGAPAS